MKIRNNPFIAAGLVALSLLAAGGCQKMERPELGDFPRDDAKLPDGPLRFYVPFDMPGDEVRFKAADSISGNPAFFSTTPLSIEGGVKGNAIKGREGTALLYLNANDMDKATNFSIAFWIKKAAQAGRTEFLFSLVQPGYSWHNSAAFVLVENQTATSTVMKFAVKDQWLEGTFNRPMFDGSWHHIVYAYNAATARMTYYFDGQEVTGLLPIQTNGPANVNFAGAKNLILGGWNKHAAQAGPTDDWIKSFLGNMDQFRIYNKTLTASEAQALFNSRL
jgi:hypothetical protein